MTALDHVLDRTVTIAQSRDYLAANHTAGGTGELVVPPDTAHRTHIDPRSRAWAAVTSRIDALLEQATAAPDPA